MAKAQESDKTGPGVQVTDFRRASRRGRPYEYLIDQRWVALKDVQQEWDLDWLVMVHQHNPQWKMPSVVAKHSSKTKVGNRGGVGSGGIDVVNGKESGSDQEGEQVSDQDERHYQKQDGLHHDGIHTGDGEEAQEEDEEEEARVEHHQPWVAPAEPSPSPEAGRQHLDSLTSTSYQPPRSSTARSSFSFSPAMRPSGSSQPYRPLYPTLPSVTSLGLSPPRSALSPLSPLPLPSSRQNRQQQQQDQQDQQDQHKDALPHYSESSLGVLGRPPANADQNLWADSRSHPQSHDRHNHRHRRHSPSHLQPTGQLMPMGADEIEEAYALLQRDIAQRLGLCDSPGLCPE